jgi:diguanylate cyclase (GGDEF)-like protein/PAS domain S-box-containing protein/putative nucleotidyltransferase with HDIG domain
MARREKIKKTGLEGMVAKGKIFRYFFDSPVVGHSITLPNGEMFFNAALCKMLGYSKKEFEGKTWRDVSFPDDLPLSDEAINNLRKNNRGSTTFKKRYLRSDGSILWAEVHVSKCPSDGGQALMTTVIDISDRLDIQKKINDLNLLYQTFLDSSEDMLFLKDGKFRYTIINQALADSFNLPKKGVLGKTDFELRTDPAAAAKCHETDLAAVQNDHPTLGLETLEGHLYETRKFKVPLGDSALGIGGYIRDVTEEDRRRKQLNQITQANRILANCLLKPFENTSEYIDFALKEFLELTNSECGHISLYDAANSEMAQSSWIVKTDAGYSQGAWQAIDEKGILTDEAGRGKKLLINDFETQDPAMIKTKTGSFPLRRFLSVPFMDKGKLAAVADFANKSSDYNEEDSGSLAIILGGLWNIVKRNQDELNMSRLLAQRDSMFENHEAVMFLIEPKSGKILETNPAAVAFYGYSKEELLKMSIQDINTLPKTEVQELLLKAAEQSQKYFTFPHRLKNGEIRYVDVAASPIPYNDKTVLFSIIFDATERVENYKENVYISTHDYLTNLYNRRYFESQFEVLNDGGHFPLAVVMGDLNGLKIINDSMGHAFGDDLLKQTAGFLSSHSKPGDVISRVGGDEFAVLKADTSEEEMGEWVKNLELIMAKGEKNRSSKPSLSVALGYAVQTAAKEDLQELMKKAESFLYANKYFDEKSLKGKTINVIMNALFEKSVREKMHSLRVGKIASRIAQQMGMDINGVNRIKTAGYLHDIGKIGIPEDVLNKAGKLSEAEWKVMKSHAARSYRILQDSGEFSNLCEIVYSHHERWDGKGYPRGLKGDEIPLEARIISVADAFDAMTNHRSYRKECSPRDAIKEIINCSGSQFDPAIVEAFVKIAKQSPI